MSRGPVSLIVTVRNEEGSIDALLDSLLSARRAPEEIVVADGGSTDGTWERLSARAARDVRVRAVHAPARHQTESRNAGARIEISVPNPPITRQDAARQ